MLISLLIGLVILVVIYWILTLIPMDARMRQIVTVVFAIIVLLWLIMVLTGHTTGLALGRV